METIACPNCREDFDVPDATDPVAWYGVTLGCVSMDGTYEARGGYDLEIVYHRCSGATPRRLSESVIIASRPTDVDEGDA